jgi:hypothetical protein
MNYALFAQYVRDIEDDLVQRFGCSREGASRIATRLELDAVNDSNGQREKNQLILEYREYGPVRLAEITGKSREWLRKKYNEAIANKSPTSEAA